jgi:hypothetical protein
MNPYLPFAAVPVAVGVALFAASHWNGGEPGRYRTPAFSQLENPAVPARTPAPDQQEADIRVAAFLPSVPPRPPAPAPTLVLHSVMTGAKVNMATINNQLVKEGDIVQGYRVKHIAADGVQLVAGGETRHLPMRPLHELPPPVEPGVDPVQQSNANQDTQDALNRSFWATFDTSQR